MKKQKKWCRLLLLRCIVKVISLFVSIKTNRIFFVCYSGRQYSCNPKYICNYLNIYYKDCFEYIWEYSDTIPKVNNVIIKFVKRNSIKYFYYLLTSKVLISNTGFNSLIPKKKGQIKLETWHGGGAYKKLSSHERNSWYFQKRMNLLNSELDYHISSCAMFTEKFGQECKIKKEKFLPIGMPRNDVFFNINNQKSNSNRVRSVYGVDSNCIIVLYAPTWRDDGRTIHANIFNQSLSEAFRNKFGKKAIYLYRGHYHKNNCDTINVIDVSDYPDMQELLCAADVLITDYSSCIWDFSFTYKPCFIYAADIQQYEQDRSFYTPIRDWPFSLAQNNKELIKNIVSFNQKKYVEKIKQHHEALGSYEMGNACETVARLIYDSCYNIRR